VSSRRILIASAAFLATFAWLVLPEFRAGPAVLWPSVLAVGLAFVTRDIYLSLFLGALGGAILLHGGDPGAAFLDLLVDRLLPSLADRWNMSVLVFTLMMGGFVEVLNRNGGMARMSAFVVGRSGDARRAGLGAYLLGWVVFFDGLANSMLIGKTLRPAADRAGLSREKLAFIVDSTSAPIAGLALLSTWVAYEMSVIRQGFGNAGGESMAAAVAPFNWLVWSLPFRFYNWLLLWLVFLVVAMMRDWGPMLAAERGSRLRRSSGESTRPESGENPSVLLALVPLVVLILGVLVGLFVDGGGLARPGSLSAWVEAFGAADAAGVFVVATAVASLVAIGLTVLWPTSTAAPGSRDDAVRAFFHGMQQMFLPALILVFAWMLNRILKELHTADYLVSLLSNRLPAGILPVLVFLLAAFVSFSTGTSWGTMAIVMPLAIPLAVALTGYQAGGQPNQALVATVAAVLAGAVFGDHCSPISDTTLVSAFSSDCDVMAHVRTQLPYALFAAALAALLGYGPAGYGVSPWLLLPAGAAAMWATVRFVGKSVV